MFNSPFVELLYLFLDTLLLHVLPSRNSHLCLGRGKNVARAKSAPSFAVRLCARPLAVSHAVEYALWMEEICLQVRLSLRVV